MKRFKQWLLILVTAFTLAGAAGCNTFEGFGKDVEDAGEEIQDASD